MGIPNYKEFIPLTQSVFLNIGNENPDLLSILPTMYAKASENLGDFPYTNVGDDRYKTPKCSFHIYKYRHIIDLIFRYIEKNPTPPHEIIHMDN